ncbi:AAA family ATPase [Chloroflexota bacterium]
MIPVNLEMRNFMCYRDNMPRLHFDGIHTACISGDNGHGKSALIDAMTWALWGKARAKNDDDLIYQNETEMRVEFDFAIGQGIYRIIRRHARPKRRRASGQSSLDLLIANGDDFKLISGDKITQTQQKIIDILHMDYDTFINSAFLRQGHADEFTKHPPAKRKEVLASILRLSLYDKLEEQAKDLSKQQETELAQLESAIKDIDDELAQKPTLAAGFDQAEAELARIEKALKERESSLGRLRLRKESLETKRSQLLQLEEHVAQAERDIKQWDEQLGQYYSRIREYETLIAQRSAIEEGYARLTEAKNSCDELDHRLRQAAILGERKHQMEMTIERAQAALITEHRLAQSRIEELDAKSLKLAQLKSELKQVETQLSQLAAREETLRRKRETSQELQAMVSHLQANTAQLKQDIGEIEEKLKLLHTQHEARCPLCETELGKDGLNLIETKYTADKDRKASTLESNRVELAARRTEAESLQGEISRLEQQLGQDRALMQSKASILSKEITEAEAAHSRLDAERDKLAEIEQHLASKDFAAGEQQALSELKAELARLDYNSQRHDEVRQQLLRLQQYENPKRKLEEAEGHIDQEREAALRAEGTIQQRQQSLEIENQRRQELLTELEALPQLAGDLTRAEAEFQTLTDQQKGAQQILWSVKAKLERCSGLEAKRTEKEKLLGQASTEERIYQELAQAFGKKGIQAWLIETALPEIEAEANKLLARMTDNRMHVKIETQRPTKKGDLLETLDINISDELGTRNYEMFSGGEAFRIDFAIRIALSKLLARRSGAPLRTLIVDEGFGTQDSGGIEKVKEAINSIQEDFDKILVITHIEELRDAFPTRIDVIKTDEGSRLEIN